MTKRIIGVIGGSGIYDMDALADVKEIAVETPFGPPSDAYITGTLDGVSMVFLARHGRGHRILPSEINYRANVYGMKSLGVEWIISLSAVGSLREDIRPGDMVVVDQFIDRTNGRPSSFFGEGIAAHVSFGDPVSPVLAEALHRAGNEVAQGSDFTVHRGGTYVVMNGPAFSTRAESNLYRSWGADVIGMTNLPEAKLAREAEISYATLALATDYDCWHDDEEEVTVDAVIAVVQKNAQRARKVVRKVVTHVPKSHQCIAANALKNAIITPKEAISTETRQRLAAVIGTYMPL